MTSPLVPIGYDEANAAGWTYHRNGICGCGFYAKVEVGALHVAWSVPDEEDEGYPVAASIPLRLLAGFAELPAAGEFFTDGGPAARWPSEYTQTWRHVADVADGRPQLYVIDFDEVHTPTGASELSGRVLVVADPTKDDGDRYAAFMLGEVLDGDASRTLRGDNFYDYAMAAAKARVAA